LETIAGHDRLYRRLVPQHLRPDGTVNSYAFMLRGQPDPTISVDLARLTTPEETAHRTGKPGAGVGALVAEVPLALGLAVRHDPLPGNAAHSLISGASTKAHCRQLAEAVTVLIRPA
jgi:hypothetical protein